MQTPALIVVVLLTLSGSAVAQSTADPYPLFADDEPLALKITGPVRQLSYDARRNDRTEHDFVVEVEEAPGRLRALDAEIRIRGKSRLTICDAPPLRLDFERDQVDGTVFEGQNHLKLVVLCRDSDSYRDYLGQEFQIYRIFNALTDRSFRVRWATVEYLDTDRRRPKPYTEPAFLIEEDWEVAERNGLNVIETENVPRDSLDAKHMTLFALFQYLIGNTDWEVIRGPDDELCCHNGKPIGTEDGPVFVLPYDFDQAGLIDAPYALPDERLHIRSVRQRLFRGFCAMNDEVGAAIARFNELRGTFEDLLNDESIGASARRRSQSYIDDFYETVNDPEKWEKEMSGDCRP
jgi:hypothetical protein